MKDFLSLAKKRKTTFEFGPGEVNDREVNDILEAGIWAPSCANSQPWHFVVVRDKKKIDELMKTANYGFFHGTNPVVIIAAVLLNSRCAGPGYACFRGKDSAVHDTFMSVGIAVQNMALQAEDMGIGSAILTPKQNQIREILKVPKSDAVPLFLALGYEKKGAFVRKRERYILENSVTHETYGGKKWIRK